MDHSDLSKKLRKSADAKLERAGVDLHSDLKDVEPRRPETHTIQLKVLRVYPSLFEIMDAERIIPRKGEDAWPWREGTAMMSRIGVVQVVEADVIEASGPSRVDADHIRRKILVGKRVFVSLEGDVCRSKKEGYVPATVTGMVRGPEGEILVIVWPEPDTGFGDQVHYEVPLEKIQD